MDHIWSYSPQCETLFQQCISAAPPEDKNNKWIRVFKKKTVVDEQDHNLTSQDSVVEITIDLTSRDPESTCKYEELFDSLGTGANLDFELLVKTCSENRELLTVVPKHLPAPSIEQLCSYVFNDQNTDGAVRKSFISILLVIFIKNYNRFYLDLIKLIMIKYTVLFTELLGRIIKDEDMPPNILSDLSMNVNNEEKNIFISTLFKIELNSNDFIKHLQTINFVYKTFEKDTNLHNYVYKNLEQFSEICKNNKNYGKLLLTFLQSVKITKFDVNKKVIKEIVEEHLSPFSKQCLLLLNNLE